MYSYWCYLTSSVTQHDKIYYFCNIFLSDYTLFFNTSFQYSDVRFSYTFVLSVLLLKVSYRETKAFCIISLSFTMIMANRIMVLILAMLYCGIVLPKWTLKAERVFLYRNQCWQIEWLSKGLWKFPHKSNISSHCINNGRCYLSW
jgi:hypothetical protein